MSSRWVYQDSAECRACNDLLSDFAGVQLVRDEAFGPDSVLSQYVDPEHEDMTRIQNFRTFMQSGLQELCCRCREQTGPTHPLDTFCASCTTGCDYNEVNNINFDAFTDGPGVTYDNLNNIDDIDAGNADDGNADDGNADDGNADDGNADDGNADDENAEVIIIIIVAVVVCLIGMGILYYCCCKKAPRESRLTQ